MQSLESDICEVLKRRARTKIETFSKGSELGFEFNPHPVESVQSMLRLICGELLVYRFYQQELVNRRCDGTPLVKIPTDGNLNVSSATYTNTMRTLGNHIFLLINLEDINTVTKARSSRSALQFANGYILDA